jgi:hypothetical protein
VSIRKSDRHSHPNLQGAAAEGIKMDDRLEKSAVGTGEWVKIEIEIEVLCCCRGFALIVEHDE